VAARGRWIAWTSAVLVAVVVAPVPGAAQDANTRFRVKTLTEEGRELQAGGAHVDAVKKFDEALSLLSHPFVKYCKAVSLEAMGRLDEARDLLREVTGHEFVGDVQADISARLARLDERLKPVPLRVATRGATGARVFVDGKFVGTTPVNVLATPGKRRLSVRMDGYRTLRDEVVVAPPGPVAREFTLVKARYGMLSVECDAPGADVFLDDDWIGTAPLKGPQKVEDGRHVLRVVRMGFADQSVDVDVTAGETTSIAASLKALVAPSPPGEGYPVASKVVLAGGVASFATGLGFLVKYLLDRGRASSGGEVDRGGLTVAVRGDDLSHTNAIVGGVLLGTGVALGVATYFLWPTKEENP
jgi:predicted metal-dependent hydrolase